LLGLGVLFRVEVSQLTLSDTTLIALLLCIIATLCASTGNLVSAKLQDEGNSVWVTTAYGMAYGATAVALTAATLNIPFTIAWTLEYLMSLGYLVVFGSVIAFASYLTLLGRIGPGRVAYSTVLFPVIALLVSVWLESYAPNEDALIAIALVLLGNWIALSKPKSPQPACVKPAP